MFKELLAREFAPYSVLSDLQLEQLENHYQLLMRWNKRLNLTRILDLTESVQFHYCESLFLGRFLPTGTQRIIDVGSGPGFPGIPIAILRPELEITLVESNKRKSVFLREAARNLNNVRVLATRAQDVEGVFDWLISRAVAPTEILRLDLARSMALLMSEGHAHLLEGASTRLPWGSDRVLFHVEQRKECHVERGNIEP